jgi:hypothetical protein
MQAIHSLDEVKGWAFEDTDACRSFEWFDGKMSIQFR